MDYIPQTKDGITHKDKAILAGIIIALVVIIAILTNANYYDSIRNNLAPADFLVTFTISDLGQHVPKYCYFVPFFLL